MKDNTFMVIEQAYALLDQHAAEDFVSKKDARDCARALRLAYESELADEKNQPYKTILFMILEEVAKATAKHPNDDKQLTDWALIVGEEAGELIRAVLQHKFEGGAMSEVITEAVQTAGTAIRLLKFLESPVKENGVGRVNYSQGFHVAVRAPEQEQANPVAHGTLMYKYLVSDDFTEVKRSVLDDSPILYKCFPTTKTSNYHGGKFEFLDEGNTFSFWGCDIEGGGFGNG